MLRIDPIPAFADNYIWAIHNDTHCAVVDPGDAAPVIVWLDEHRLSLSAILVTHHHADHVGGVEALRRRYPGVLVIGPATGAIPHRTRALREGDTVTLDALAVSFDVWEIPGHTADHIAFVNDDAAFIGDTVFAAGCGRVFDGTIHQLFNSVQRLSTLPDHTRCYCAHEYTLANLRFASAAEPDNENVVHRAFAAQALREVGAPTVPFSMADERATNPFFRTHCQSVREQCERRTGQTLHDAAAVFAALRDWKNTFRS
jgi:hydroxyacylglutathione hydrolase